MGRAERITEMEGVLNEARVAVDGLEGALGRLEGLQGDIAELATYYGSAQWFEDRAADEAGELPGDLARGVLGEDEAYNLLLDYRDLAIRMLEAATRALKEA